jgi:hypothetical protein
MFRSPFAIDRNQFRPIDTPEDFRDEIRETKIDVLPLVREKSVASRAGWCTYVYEFNEAPELEVLSGGVNHKSPKAGAIWRQGNLLHFGFSPSPKEMTDAGQSVLLDSICYIARFTEDRPIVHTPCVFVQGKRLTDRDVLRRILDNPKRELSSLKYYLEKKTGEELADKDRATLTAWHRDVRDYLHADDDGKLLVDADARQFGVGPARAAFLEKAVLSLASPEQAPLARRLLSRYAPDGPGADGTVERWRAWARENGPYLFFSDAGGYRWYVDPLAKRRGVPTGKLRGIARATRPSAAGVDSQP